MTFSPVQTRSSTAPPAISALLQTPETLLSRLTLPRMNAFSRCLLLAPSTHPEIQGCSPPRTRAIMTRTSLHPHSLLAESAHRLRPFTQPFFHPATVDEAHPAPPSTSSHFSPHNDLTFIQERRSTLPPPTLLLFLASP